MAFSNIEDSEKLDIIDIAIVNDIYFDTNYAYKETFKVLGDEENEERLFNIKYVEEDEARNLLQKDEIIGYMILKEDGPQIVVQNSGIDETIFKYIVEEIIQEENIMKNIFVERVEKVIKVKPEEGNLNSFKASIYKEVLEKSQEEGANIQDISNNNLSYTMIEFYTLIAMTCLYGGILGMVAINHNLPNMSNTGKRVSISKTSKGKLVLSSLLASYLVQLIGLLLLFLYTIFVINVDYGNNLPLIIILAMVGSFAGLTMGLTISTIFKVNENLKTGIIIK